MTLKGETTINGYPHAKTLYLTIPADMAKDSQFPFKQGEQVFLECDPDLAKLTISKQRNNPIQFTKKEAS